MRVREETPAPMLERTAGLEPTPPYWTYGALQSFVRKNHTRYATRQRLPVHRSGGIFVRTTKSRSPPRVREEAPVRLVRCPGRHERGNAR